MIDIEVLKRHLSSRKKTIHPVEFKNSPFIKNIKRAGVMILLLPSQSDSTGYSILFNQRSNEVPQHKGQIAFPGGGFKDEDISLINTAIRETYEETGLKISRNNILGEIDDFFTISEFLVTPFISLGPQEPRTYTPDGWEIVESFDIPVSKLIDENNHEIKTRNYLNHIFNVHYYYCNDKIIWGVTGEMLYYFLQILKELFFN